MEQNVKMNEEETEQTVERLLLEFDKDFKSNNVAELRDQFPRYVALYTKFIYQPDIVIRGINPSWFSGKEPESEEDILEEDRRVNSLQGLHKINSYIEYREPPYHYYLCKDLYSAAGEEFIKDRLMGWNDCFIQLGGQGGMAELKGIALQIDKKNQNSFCQDLIKKSKSTARKLEQLIQPKLIIYAGREAAWESRWNKKIFATLKSMKDTPKPTPWGGKAIVVKHFSYPDPNREAEIVSAMINEEIKPIF